LNFGFEFQHIHLLKMASFPPLRSHPSTPITSDLALQKLQEYLSAIHSNPYLLPNATLQSDGPRAAGDSSSSLVIHNLKRVEAGLRGEWLEPSLDLESEGHGVVPIAGVVKGTGRENLAVEEGEEENGEGWQDLDEYQRQQSVEGGEIGERHTDIGQEGNEAIHPGVEVGGEGISEEMRKKLRKEAKKTRKEKEKRERVLKGK
jgi:hypothetical protein